ncbi:hypothetical protein [Candidatus Parabeggiatoa sp. HSG14]|uniref:hypothetical protein n=1 Tax=Candidatus Parabeggiatoa sp. HSG14 TaxID=3055593 RepID=UPI0025A8BB33|nr:hypothetical protein [Thiotrichales bacterium HSG14]
MPTTSENKLPQLRYEQTTALYASQFVISATGEEVIINFSSGNMPDPTTGNAYLPVHTRIALSSTGARKLANLINQALTAAQTPQTFEDTKLHKLQS